MMLGGRGNGRIEARDGRDLAAAAAKRTGSKTPNPPREKLISTSDN
jgi:hypothetical protein